MKPTTDPLGQFEQLVLGAVLACQANPYAVPIYDRVCEMAKREVNIAAVYATLERLEEKEYVSSKLGESTPERGGRPKRYYTVLPAAKVALREALATARRIESAVRYSLETT